MRQSLSKKDAHGSLTQKMQKSKKELEEQFK